MIHSHFQYRNSQSHVESPFLLFIYWIKQLAKYFRCSILYTVVCSQFTNAHDVSSICILSTKGIASVQRQTHNHPLSDKFSHLKSITKYWRTSWKVIFDSFEWIRVINSSVLINNVNDNERSNNLEEKRNELNGHWNN